ASATENPVGVLVANYVSKNVSVMNANVQGTRIGVSSPFFYGRSAEAKDQGFLTVENGYFRTNIGVNVATGYIDDARAGVPVKKAVVRSMVFVPLTTGAVSPARPEAISMNYGMAPEDARPRDPVLVYDFNKQ